MTYNSIRNQRFANRLYKYPLPPHTERLSQETLCFCPLNGGTCALVFSETLRTSLNEQQIKSYYADIRFPPLRKKPVSEEYQQVKVILNFDSPQQADEQIQFTASIGEPFYDGGLFDWRCR